MAAGSPLAAQHPMQRATPQAAELSVDRSTPRESVSERTTCMAKRIGLVALLFLGWLAVPLVRADEQTGQPFVVLVGIDHYQDPQIKTRKHAEADAKALYNLLVSKDNLNVSTDRAKLLLGSGQGADKATKENILKALQAAEKSAKKRDLVIFAM